MIEITKDLKPIKKKVLLRKLVKTLDKKYGNIIIPQSIGKLYSLGIGQIVDLGNEAKQNTNLNKQDIVLFDYYSTYGEYPEYVITNYQNIVVKLNQQQADQFCNKYVISKL